MNLKNANISIFIPHAGCNNACVFCNQRVISGSAGNAALEEIAFKSRLAAENEVIDKSKTEIAFFGGSFTAVGRGLMKEYLEQAQKQVKKYGFKGIRCSTRPDAVDREILDILVSYGVTAVEIGAQSFDEGVLAACGRGHTARDTMRAAALIKEFKLELVVQLMTGLPKSDDKKDMNSLERALSLEPVGIRIYPTLVIKGSPLEAMWKSGEYCPQTLSEAVLLCARMYKKAECAGVNILKMGLHASEAYGEGELLAGPYHPAFRELVISEIFYGEVMERMSGEDIKGGRLALYVAPKNLSAAIGQNRSNLIRLKEALSFSELVIKADDGLSGRAFLTKVL